LTSEQIANVLQEFQLQSVNELNFEIDDTITSVEELRDKIILSQVDCANDPVQTELLNKEPAKFRVDVTYEEKRSALRDAVEALSHWDENNYENYRLIDFTEKYAYIEYRACAEGKDEKGCVRIEYSMVDDNVVLAFETKVAVKLRWLTKEDEAALEAKETEFSELKSYKANRLEEDKRQAFGRCIEQFSDLIDNDEYKAVVGRAMEFSSVDELEKELFAIRGKFGTLKNTKKNVSDIRIPVQAFSTKKDTSLADEERDFMQRYNPAALR
jgi:hypothetical protein